MRLIIAILAILWFLFGLFYVEPCFKAYCDGSDSGTSGTSGTSTVVDSSNVDVVTPATEIAAGPLLFRWDSEGAITGDGWEARRQAILDGLKDDEALEITGLYRADEVNNTTYENLGLARAHEVAQLFKPPLTDDRFELRGKLVNAADTDKTTPFKSAEFRNLKNTESIKEIDDKTIIRFPFNSVDKLDADDVEAYLDDVAERVNKTGERVRLTGHTDNVDSHAFNNRLGMKRANIVKDYLISKGVDPSKIIAESKGETKPIADNSTRSGRAQNRRTELQIIK